MRGEILAVFIAVSLALTLVGAILIAVIRMPAPNEITLYIRAKEGKALFNIKSSN